MSLYEASAHIFYGVRVQRMGRDADDTLPLGSNEDDELSDAKSLLKSKGLWRETPDWYAAFTEFKKTNKDPKIQYLYELRNVDPDHAVVKLYEEHEAAIREQTFGCELRQMGSGESDDTVIYVVIKDSMLSSGSEDDHGGFGEEVIPADKLVKGADWDERLAKFCEKIGLPADLVKPRWTLTMCG